jgi:hypothetical protein
MLSLPKRQFRVIEGLLLIMVLLLAFFMASIPHFNYLYLLHIDEWWHYGDAQSLIETGRIPYPDPFNGGEPYVPDVEVGYHLLIGVIQLVTGLSWLTLFRFLPGVILALLAFQAYALGRGRKFGLGAAFLVCLIPTTIRLLGPAFLVPVSLGLMYLPLIIFILHRLVFTARGVAILFLLLLTLLFLHPPTMAVVSVITIMHLLFSLPGKENLRLRWKISAFIFGLTALVYIFLIFWAPSALHFVVSEALDPELHMPMPAMENMALKYGMVPLVLFLLGVGLHFYRRNRGDLAVVTSAFGLLVFQQLYPHLYIGPDIIYERGWLYILVLMAPIGAIALKAIWGWLGQAWQHRPGIASVAACAVIGVLVAVSLFFSIRNGLSEYYYHVVDDEMYQEFLWIKEYVPPQHRIGIADTHEAWPFAAIAQKYAYTAEVSPRFHAKGRAAMEFLKTGAQSTPWLIASGISLVYSHEEVINDDLIKINKDLYLLVTERQQR